MLVHNPLPLVLPLNPSIIQPHWAAVFWPDSSCIPDLHLPLLIPSWFLMVSLPILCGPPYPSECPGSQQLQQYWDLILSRSAAVLMKADIVFWFLCDSETKPSIWVKGPMQSIPNARDSTPGTVANKCIQHPNLPLQREPTLSRSSDWSFTSTRYVEMQGFQTLRP